MAATPDTIDIVIPNYGAIRGIVDHSRQIAIFRNVPYAVVPERWRVAVKPESWTGVRDATKQGPVCPQMPSFYPLGLLVPEDFEPYGTGKYQFGVDHDEKHGLNLNIYVPLLSLKEGAEPTPVMTWIHGGANRDGSNAVPLYNASNFVQHSIQLNQPMIIVAVNYRVNMFGFLASKELVKDMQEYAAASPTPISPYDQSVGNWGLMDQKLAFEWVRENISAFGGNSRNVTAWGESAGSIAIHYHMLCPAHHGLFDHAIMQSGTVCTMPAGHPQVEGQVHFDALLQKLDIPLDLDAKEKIKRLRRVSMEELSKAGENVPAGGYCPFYDGGKLIPSDVPIQMLATDQSAYDPNLKSVMIGANKDEGSAFAKIYGDRNMQTWPNLYKKLVPNPKLAPVFEAAYGVPKTDEDVVHLMAQFTGDFMFLYPTQTLYKTFQELAKTRQGFKVTQYQFDVSMQRMEELVPGLGAMHAGELPFVFSPPAVEKVLTSEELALGKEMQKKWIAFAGQREEAFKLSSIHLAETEVGNEKHEQGLFVNGRLFAATEDGSGHENVFLSKEATSYLKFVTSAQQEHALKTSFRAREE
ncbi:Alpha/Beta hydrolase protein [Dissophora ornata]|nr:hypothetical protein BGZ58_002557 [Dissophora ornata]KAI8606602.1 Alpha/Beta hydrolase protein [Dissophora ornata]